jgi:predicted ester cyclase
LRGTDPGAAQPPHLLHVQGSHIAAQEHLAENLNAGKVDVAVESFAEDAVDRNPAPDQGAGREGFRGFWSAMLTAFPDAHIEPAHLAADDEHVTVAYTLTGTHKGDFQGHRADRQDHRDLRRPARRFESGKIVERWGSSDELGIVTQLGAA